ncbi:MAG: glycosyl hydrolase [Pirellulales bacterium]
MLQINSQLTPADLAARCERLWSLARTKIRTIDTDFGDGQPAPVITVGGRYQPQGWTEWTQGFQFGCALLAFDATNDAELLELGRSATLTRMASHVTHIGVHDHGFNNVSTYGNLLRLMNEGRIVENPHERQLYELALKASGAVQAARWSTTADGQGYIHSFNGPHSLFCDTIRSLRSLALAHRLGHALMGENDVRISLLDRLVQHARTTAAYNVYFGQQRDVYDTRGRVAHESIFNRNDGRYRCSSTQQGYSPFSTWTRGLAWVMLGYPEQLEFLATVSDAELEPLGGRWEIDALMLEAARAACDFYIENAPIDGVPYWDTGAPGLVHLQDYLDRPADPFNDREPVDSSAAAIASQGLMRLGRLLQDRGEETAGQRYFQAGLTTLSALSEEPYLATDPDHQGLLLHTIYHRPRGWDYIPPGAKTPRGEACMWGDYHLLEAALYAERLATNQPYYTFFG